MNIEKMIREEMESHAAVLEQVTNELRPAIAQACDMVTDALSGGHKVLLCGNGGSAADAQHIAAELSGRFRKERKALPGIALTTDTSALTAISNDYGFEAVFSRQVEALAREGDILIAISTSGNSPNILRAVAAAKEMGCISLGLAGGSGGKLAAACDFCVTIPSKNTARVQEMHILIGHILCEAVDILTG